MKYQIYKIDGEKLRTIYNDFYVDFNDEHCFKSLATNTILRNDNALFYQLKEVLGKGEQDSFLNHLVYIDFNKAVRLDNKNLLKRLFDGTKNNEKGLVIKCKDGKERRFIAFDKSNSMSKAGCIYFIDEDLKEELDKRLLLNFPFNKMRINSSQYFSYRGLYLSDSIRIDDIELDEKKVLIIDDSIVSNNQNTKVFTAERNPKDVEELVFKTEPNYSNHFFNRFDGEGFVSFDYAKKINDILNKNATSFQIRLPFAKGMVHAVDFREFINEHNKDTKKCVKVKDYLGIERDLDEIEVILTKSMFKCSKWFDKYIKTQAFKDDYKKVFNDKDYDVIKLYFYYLNQYKHSLYISATNEEYTKKNSQRKTTINYQFINTLALNEDEFNDLINQNIEEIDKVNDSYFIDEEDEENDDYQDSDDLYSIYKKAVSLNSSFLSDPRISSFIKSKKLGLAKNIGIGRLITEGENRFLASDLLALLIHLYRQTSISNDDIIKELVDSTIHDYRFYMPNNHVELSEENYYAILRNPHLSRNEETIAKPYVPENDSLLDKYFSHLDGVIMVGSRSLIPSTLGGADFDGDLVKIYSSKSIVDAVFRGCYKQSGRHIKRVLPIVSIPNLDSDELDESLDSISYKKIKDTFNSEIGFISNCSVRYGEVNHFVSKDSDYQARCSIIAGLEIDAAKKGWHPTKAIESLQKEIDQLVDEISKDENIKLDADPKKRNKQFKKYSDYFIDIKEDISHLKLIYKISNNKIKDTAIISTNNNDSYLSQLPSRFVDAYNGVFDNSKINEINGKLFDFEDDPLWSQRLDNKILDKLEKLIKAYNKVIDIKQSSIEGKYKKMKDDLSCIYTNLQSMYADVLEDYVFDETKSNIKVALEDTFATLKEDYLDELNSNKKLEDIYDYIYDNLSIESNRDTREKQNTFLILFNPEYNDYDNPILLFKYIVNYVKGIVNNKVELKGRNNEYLEDFETIINIATGIKQEKNIWKDNIIQKTRLFLYEDLFKDNKKDSVKYVYSLRNVDKKANFFWDILDKEDVVSSIKESNYAGRIIGI